MEQLGLLKGGQFHSLVYYCRGNSVAVMARGTNKFCQVNEMCLTEFEKVFFSLMKYVDVSLPINLHKRIIGQLIKNPEWISMAGGAIAMTHHPMSAGQFMCVIGRTLDSYLNSEDQSSEGQSSDSVEMNADVRAETLAAQQAQDRLKELVCADILALSNKRKGTFQEYEIRLEPMTDLEVGFTPFWGLYSINYGMVAIKH